MLFKQSLLLFAAMSVGIAQAQTALPLRHGMYAASSVACADAPMSVIQTIDQFGIQYPHLGGCKAHVTAHHGPSYSLDQTCNGGEHDKVVIHILGPARYSVGQGNDAQVFRYCGVGEPQTAAPVK